MSGNPTAASSLGVYGTLGTPTIFNVPGARQGVMNWKDNNGNFWMFGGTGYGGSGTSGDLGDLWRYRVK